jgi:hypothetical protein
MVAYEITMYRLSVRTSSGEVPLLISGLKGGPLPAAAIDRSIRALEELRKYQLFQGKAVPRRVTQSWTDGWWCCAGWTATGTASVAWWRQ